MLLFDYPPEIRKVPYTTYAIESITKNHQNSQFIPGR